MTMDEALAYNPHRQKILQMRKVLRSTELQHFLKESKPNIHKIEVFKRTIQTTTGLEEVINFFLVFYYE